MSSHALFEVEDREAITILQLHPPSRGLLLTDPDVVVHLWRTMHDVASKKQQVLLIFCHEGLLAPERVDEAWEDILQTSGPKRELPPQLRALQTNWLKLLDYYHSSRTLAICAFSGPTDLDLFGLLTPFHYRICTEASTIENRTIDRTVPPGLATVWALSRIVGFAHANEIILDGTSFTAEEAHKLKLVNAVVPTDQLYAFAEEKAVSLASKPPVALRSLVVAMNHAHESIPQYLNAIGAGFSAVFEED